MRCKSYRIKLNPLRIPLIILVGHPIPFGPPPPSSFYGNDYVPLIYLRVTGYRHNPSLPPVIPPYSFFGPPPPPFLHSSLFPMLFSILNSILPARMSERDGYGCVWPRKHAQRHTGTTGARQQYYRTLQFRGGKRTFNVGRVSQSPAGLYPDWSLLYHLCMCNIHAKIHPHTTLARNKFFCHWYPAQLINHLLGHDVWDLLKFVYIFFSVCHTWKMPHYQLILTSYWVFVLRPGLFI